MPKETIWYYFVCFLFFLPPKLPAQPAGSPVCRFDDRHLQYQANDAIYRERSREVEFALQQLARQRLEARQVSFRDEDTVLTIPVVVHLFYPPGTTEGNTARPSTSQVQRAIQELNNGFRNRGAYAGGPYFSNAGIPSADTQIEFRLATVSPQGLPANGLVFNATSLAGKAIDATVNGVEVLDSLRRLSAWPSDRYLNIYVLPKLCDRSGDCPSGFAYQAAAHGRDFDGVYVISQVMAGDIEVLIHEVGHYLNLYHTFEGGCSETDCLTGGDRVCDTPPDCNLPSCAPSIGNCLLEQRQNTCHNDAQITHSPFTQDVDDLYENFMDYGYWKCFNSFTPGQRERMRDALLQVRFSLLSSFAFQPSDTCRIDSVVVLATDTCRVPGVESWAHLLLHISNPPDADTLLVNGHPFTTYDSPVLVRLPAPEDGHPLALEAYFRKTPQCRLNVPALLTIPTCAVPLHDRIQTAPFLPVARAGTCQEELARWLPPASTRYALPDWPATCTAYAGGEQWLRLIVPETGEVSLSLQAEDPAAQPALAVFAAQADTLLDCRSAESGGRITYSLRGRPAGDTLAVAVWYPPGITQSPLQLCAYLATPPPPNDQCRGALPLPLSDERYGQTCTATIPVDWAGALRDAPYPCEEEEAGPDVWFYTLTPPSGQLSIQPVGAGAKTTGLAAYAGCDLPPLACGQMSLRGRPEINLTSRPVGDTIFIRVWPTARGTGAVRLCATLPPVPAPNDDCDQALSLEVAASHERAVPLLISNVIATASGRRNTCENDAADDLWYRLVVPPQGAVTVEVASSVGVVSPSLAAYNGCRGSEIVCENTTGDRASLALENLTPGDTILIALWDFFGFRYGSAELLAYVPPPPINDFCSSAFLLPIGFDSTQARLVLRKMRQATSSADQPNCSNGPAPDLWYELKAPSSGKLLIELPPSEGRAGIALLRSCQGTPLSCLLPGERRLLSGLTPGERILLSAWSEVDSLALRLFAVPECPSLLITGQPPSCAGAADGSVNVATTLPADVLSFHWNTGSTSPVLRNIPAGAYQVTVTSPYQCRDTLSLALAEPPALSGELEASPLRTDGGTGYIVVKARGGTPPYTYRLDEGAPQTSDLFEDLSPGRYRLTITDANGCSWSDVVEINTLTTTAGNDPAVWTRLSVFPNPTPGVLTMEVSLRWPLPLRATLLDPLGRKVLATDSPAASLHRLQWNVKQTSPGMYLLRMEVGKVVVTRKVVIME